MSLDNMRPATSGLTAIALVAATAMPVAAQAPAAAARAALPAAASERSTANGRGIVRKAQHFGHRRHWRGGGWRGHGRWRDRGWRSRGWRHGYRPRRHRGAGIAADIAGLIIGGAIAASKRHYADRWERCDERYRSFRWSDGTFQPYGGGPRRLCPYLRR